MSEIFKNYLSISSSGEKVIVPAAGSSARIHQSNTTYGNNTRDDDSTAQVHSLYIAQHTTSRLRDDNRYSEDYFNYVDLYVKDTDTGATVYVAYDLQIVPGAPYYIEKNITLTPTQQLCINIPSNQGYNGSSDIHIVASTVLFVEDVEV